MRKRVEQVKVEQCPPGICEGAIVTVVDEITNWHLRCIGEDNELHHQKITYQTLLSKNTAE